MRQEIAKIFVWCIFAALGWLVVAGLVLLMFVGLSNAQCNPPCPYSKIGCCSELFRPAIVCPPTGTPSITRTPTVTYTVSSTPTITLTPTITSTATSTPTITNTSTRTNTVTMTPTVTSTPTITNTATRTSTASATATATNTPATFVAVDWSSCMVAVWEFEEATNAARLNSTLATCGVLCDLDQSNTADQETSIKVVGSASASMDGSTSTDILGCPFADCGNGQLDVHGSTTWGGFVRVTTDITSTSLLAFGTVASGNQAYSVGRDATIDATFCAVTNGAGTRVATDSGASAFPIDAWVFNACKFDDAANLMYVCPSAACDAGTAQTDMRDQTAGTFTAGLVSATVPLAGYIDESFVYSGVLSNVNLCRICSCGVNGSLCTCDSGTPANYTSEGRNNAAPPAGCGNCTLPACNLSASSACGGTP